MDNPNVITRQFDLGQHDDRAIFPMRIVGSTQYIIVSKEDFIMTETPSTYVLEINNK